MNRPIFAVPQRSMRATLQARSKDFNIPISTTRGHRRYAWPGMRERAWPPDGV